MPEVLLLIGMQGSGFEAGAPISSPVRQCVPHVIDAVLRELHRLNVWYEPKAKAAHPGIWWERKVAA
jgi:hypothetical protein